MCLGSYGESGNAEPTSDLFCCGMDARSHERAFMPERRAMAPKNYTFTCIECKQSKMLVLEENDVRRWNKGEKIQEVFPQLTLSDRELMISNICGDCFDEMFADEQGKTDGVEP